MNRDEVRHDSEKVMANCPLSGLSTLCTLRFCVQELRRDNHEQCKWLIQESAPYARKR